MSQRNGCENSARSQSMRENDPNHNKVPHSGMDVEVKKILEALEKRLRENKDTVSIGLVERLAQRLHAPSGCSAGEKRLVRMEVALEKILESMQQKKQQPKPLSYAQALAGSAPVAPSYAPPPPIRAIPVEYTTPIRPGPLSEYRADAEAPSSETDITSKLKIATGAAVVAAHRLSSGDIKLYFATEADKITALATNEQALAEQQIKFIMEEYPVEIRGVPMGVMRIMQGFWRGSTQRTATLRKSTRP